MAFARVNDNVEHLVRSHIWSQELKELLRDDLMATSYVRWLTEFPDGDTFVIPSIGQAHVRDYHENEPVVYDALDTGEFQFTITEYLSSATYITRKARQDAFYASQLESRFVPEQRRSIMEHVESNVLALHRWQEEEDKNAINEAAHRRVASGDDQAMAVSDFAKSMYALKKANVPQTQMIAIVDPSVEYIMNTQTNLVNVSNNRMWEGIVADGIATGMRFTRNIYGFDVWTSNYLDGGISETIDGDSVSDGIANLFFSAEGNVLPFVGAWRQMPTVDSEFNKDKQREEYITTARYGTKLYRPENLVTVLSEVPSDIKA